MTVEPTNGIRSSGTGSKALGALKEGFDGVKGKFSKVLDFPDTLSTPEKRKMCRIAYDVGLIVLASLLIYFSLNVGGMPTSIGSMSLMKFIGLPTLLGGAGFALTLLLEDIGVSNTARKAMAVALPIFIAATASLLIYSGFHAGVFAPNSMSFPTIVGILVAPLAVMGVGTAIGVVSEKTRTPLGSLSESDRRRSFEEQRQAQELERQVQR